MLLLIHIHPERGGEQAKLMGSGITHDSKFTVADRVEYITVVTEIMIKFSGSQVRHSQAG